MNVLEKILEEIEERIKRLKEADNMCRVNAERNRNFESMKYFQSLMFATERAESIIGDIIRSHMDEAKDTNVPSNDGWIPVEERLPEDCEEIVLVQVSGKMAENIWFDNAFELATYVNGEGWILENHREWENPKVIAWQPLPEPYKPKKDVLAAEHAL